MNPLLCWQGGKTKLKKRIISKIPSHDKYVEPFVGGGSVFFGKEPAKKNVINDKNKELVNFYKQVSKKGCNLIQKCELPKSKSDFEKAKNGKGACNFFGSTKMSFGCMRSTYNSAKRSNGSKGNGKVNAEKNCNEYKELLSKTSITNRDYKNVIKQHDSKSTFFYLDPPYYKSSAGKNYANGSKDITPKEVCGILKDVKGKFILSYNNHPEVRKACKGFKIGKVDTAYELQRGNKSFASKPKKVTELLIRNY